jgi:hypothetical protein
MTSHGPILLAGAGLLLVGALAPDPGPNLPVTSLGIASSLAYTSRSRFRDEGSLAAAIQDLVELVKFGDGTGLALAARIVSRHPSVAGFRGAVVPIPRSHANRPSMLSFADQLVACGVGTRAVALLSRRDPVPSSRMLRREGRRPISALEHFRSMSSVDGVLEPHEPVLLLDDIVTQGNVMIGAACALRAGGHFGSVTGATLAWYHDPSSSHVNPSAAVISECQVDADGYAHVVGRSRADGLGPLG